MVRVMTCALSQTVRFAPLEAGAVADIARLRLVSISLLKSTGVWLLLATFVISNTARGSLTNTTGQLFKYIERLRNDITHVFLHHYQCTCLFRICRIMQLPHICIWEFIWEPLPCGCLLGAALYAVVLWDQTVCDGRDCVWWAWISWTNCGRCITSCVHGKRSWKLYTSL